MLTETEVEALSERWRTAYSRRLQDFGPLEAVLAELRRAVESNPDDASLHFMLGCTLEAAGLPEEALAPLRKVLKVDPEGAAVHYYLGLAFQGLDRYDEAHGISAMMRTTGYSLSITGQLQARGEIPAGVCTPDECVPAARYVDELAKRGVVIREVAGVATRSPAGV